MGFDCIVSNYYLSFHFDIHSVILLRRLKIE